MKQWLITWNTWEPTKKRKSLKRVSHRIVIGAETIGQALQQYYSQHSIPPSTVWDIIKDY